MTSVRLLPRKRSSRLVVYFFMIVAIFFVSIKLLLQGLDQFPAYPSNNDSDSSAEIQFDEESDHEKYDANLERELISSALSQVGNLPDAEFILQRNPGKFSKCANFPNLYRLEFSNLHWQVQNIGNLTFYLYNAYYDSRISSIRILTMVSEPTKLTVDTVCQLWYRYDKKAVPISAKSQLPVWYSKWSQRGRYTAHMITCHLPKSKIHEGIPVSVSLVGNECDNATNNLALLKNDFDVSRPLLVDGNLFEKKKIRFGVCVKGLDFLHNDQSFRLIEWIELLLIMGVEKIFFYEFAVHPNVKAVLEHYKKLGKVDLTPLTLPGTLPNEPGLRHLFLSNSAHAINKRKTEVIPYNDCLYRNLDKFDYLSVLDTDEIIIPKNSYNWEDMLNEINQFIEQESLNTTKNKGITSYCFRNIYFFDSIPLEKSADITQKIPSHLHMLKHIFRAANYTPPTKFVKCIHSTKKTLIIHNHFPLKCIDGPCNIHHTDYGIAHMQHYRSTCVRDLKNCDEYENSPVQDATIWKYKDELINRVDKTVSELRLLRA